MESTLTVTISLCWLQAWTLEPECLGLNPASAPVLGEVSWETVSDSAGSLLGLALRGKTCKGVRRVGLGREGGVMCDPVATKTSIG